MSTAPQAVSLYHNPRCSKSRAALALLHERGIAPEVIEYLKEPPSALELTRILKLLGVSARTLMRKQEPAYEALGLADPALSEEALIAAMVREPILIERPIAVAAGRAVIGRPPEKVLEICVS